MWLEGDGQIPVRRASLACGAGSDDPFGAKREPAGSGGLSGAKREATLNNRTPAVQDQSAADHAIAGRSKSTRRSGAPVVSWSLAGLAYSPSFSFSFFASSSLRMRRRILPTIVLGSSLRNSTKRGTLYLANRSLQKALISSDVAVCPSFKMM